MRKLLIILFICMLTGCSLIDKVKSSIRPVVSSNCGAILDWVDFLMINDIHYYANRTAGDQTLQKGRKLGEVKFRMSDNVTCTDYKTKNGDAAFLQEGTEIYEFKGYSDQFRVIAGDKVYQVVKNKNAKTIGALYDIKGKVVKINVYRDAYDQDIRTIASEKVEKVTNLFLDREIVELTEIYRRGVPKTTYQYFMDFILEDGTSVSTMYMAGSEVFSRGAYVGPELEQELKAFTLQEWNQ